MRSIMLFLFLTFAWTPVPAIGAGQDLQTGLPGNDWRVMTIELPPGAVESWQSRPEGELLYVLEGSGRLEMNGKPPVTLNPGTVTRLDARPRHVVKNTSGAGTLKVLVVFFTENGQGHPLLAAGKMHRFEGNAEPIKKGIDGSRPSGNPHGSKETAESQDMGLIF